MAVDTVAVGTAVLYTDGNYVDQVALVRKQHTDGTCKLAVFLDTGLQYVDNAAEGQGDMAGQQCTWRLVGSAGNYGNTAPAPAPQQVG